MTPRRRALLAGSHLMGLWAVVVAQPLFDLLAANPEFFVAHRAGRADLLAVVAGIVLVMPAIAAALVWLVRAVHARAGDVLLDLIVGLLVALLALQIGKRLGAERAAILLPLSAAAGVAGAVAYHRLAAVRSFATMLSLAAIVVPAVLLAGPSYRRLLSPGESGAAAAAGARPVPIVMVVLDETPLASLVDLQGRIDPASYPNLASLARDGTWFRNATTVSDYTRWALPAIVTGQLPQADAAPAADDHPNSLFSLVSETHQVEGLEAVTRLCPETICAAVADPFATRLEAIASDLWIVYQHIVLPRELKGHLPELTGDWANFGAAAGVRQRERGVVARRRAERRLGGGDDVRSRSEVARRFVERITAGEPDPRFWFLHTMLPHTPHVLLPTGQTNGTRAVPKVLELTRALPGKYRETWSSDEWVLAVHYQRHLLQLAHFDSVVGDLVRQLKEQGLYGRALVVILSDHGTSFRPGSPRRDFTEATAAEIAPILLVVKFPEGSPDPAGPIMRIDGQNVSDRNVETIDIAPTVAHVLGVALPWKAAGRSLLDASTPERPSKVLYYDFARRTRTFGAHELDIAPIVRRKATLFGGSENLYRVPQPPRFAALIGRPLSELQVGEGGGTAVVDYLSEFRAMQVTADPVAFDVAGTLEGRQGTPPAYLAVSVNGTVRAVTRSWLQDPRGWLATPPLSAWRNGENDLQVFVIDGDDANPRLLRCAVRPGASR